MLKLRSKYEIRKERLAEDDRKGLVKLKTNVKTLQYIFGRKLNVSKNR